MKNFKPEYFFDLSDFYAADVFSGLDNAWDVLPKIEEYVSQKIGGKKYIIGNNTQIEDSVLIKGPALIGKNCRIGHAAFIRENVIIGDNCIIGHAVELKNCIILNNTNVAHLNYVGDSVVGSHVNVGGGATFANVRLDEKPVQVLIDGEKIHTRLAKFGAIVGDGTKIGAHSVLNPGALIGKNSLVYPLSLVKGFHSENSKITR